MLGKNDAKSKYGSMEKKMRINICNNVGCYVIISLLSNLFQKKFDYLNKNILWLQYKGYKIYKGNIQGKITIVVKEGM